MRKHYNYTTFITMQSLIVSAITFGQEAPPHEEPIIELESYTVLATRYDSEESRSPITVSTFSDEFLQTAFINDIDSLASYVPGFQFTSSVNGKGFSHTLRGVGSEGVLISVDPAVGYSIDGIYYNTGIHTGFSYFDIETAEISLGPQGTLRGRNTIIGSIGIVNKKPEHADLHGSIEITRGNFDHTQVEAVANIPILESNQFLSTRFSIYQNSRDGFVENLNNPSLDDRDELFLRGQVLYEPTDDFELLLAYHRWEQDDRGFARVPFGAPVANGPFPLAFSTPQPSDTDRIAVNNVQQRDNEANSLHLKIEYDWHDADMTLTSLTSYQHLNSFVRNDADTSDLSITTGDDDEEGETFTQEMRAQWKPESKWKVTAGTFFSYEDREQIVSAPNLGLPQPAFIVFSDFTQKTQSVSIFTETTYEAWENIFLTGGVRYTKDEKEFTEASLVPPLPPTFTQNKETWDSLDYRGEVSWHPSENWLLYATVSTGYKSGGYFPGFALSPDSFEPERLLAYEIGSRRSFLNDTLSAGITLFHYDYTDLQVPQFRGLATIINNAAEASIEGIELELNWKAESYPKSGWSLGANIAFTDAHYDEFRNFAYELDPTNTPQDISGNEIKRTPPIALNLTGNYRFPFKKTNLDFFARFYWADRAHLSDFNDSRFIRPAYHQTDLSLTWSEKEHARWSISLFVKNLEDRVVPLVFDAGELLLGTYNTYQYSDPRTYGVRVSYLFD